MLWTTELGLHDRERTPLVRKHRTLLRNDQWRRVIDELDECAELKPAREEIYADVSVARPSRVKRRSGPLRRAKTSRFGSVGWTSPHCKAKRHINAMPHLTIVISLSHPFSSTHCAA